MRVCCYHRLVLLSSFQVNGTKDHRLPICQHEVKLHTVMNLWYLADIKVSSETLSPWLINAVGSGPGPRQIPLLWIAGEDYVNFKMNLPFGMLKFLFMNVWAYVFINYIFPSYSWNAIGILPYKEMHWRVSWKTTFWHRDIFKEKVEVSFMPFISCQSQGFQVTNKCLC